MYLMKKRIHKKANELFVDTCEENLHVRKHLNKQGKDFKFLIVSLNCCKRFNIIYVDE